MLFHTERIVEAAALVAIALSNGDILLVYCLLALRQLRHRLL
jgi:hypothetical protein